MTKDQRRNIQKFAMMFHLKIPDIAETPHSEALMRTRAPMTSETKSVKRRLFATQDASRTDESTDVAHERTAGKSMLVYILVVMAACVALFGASTLLLPPASPTSASMWRIESPVSARIAPAFPCRETAPMSRNLRGKLSRSRETWGGSPRTPHLLLWGKVSRPGKQFPVFSRETVFWLGGF